VRGRTISRPRLLISGEFPFKKSGESLLHWFSRIKKMCAVKMIRLITVIVSGTSSNHNKSDQRPDRSIEHVAHYPPSAVAHFSADLHEKVNLVSPATRVMPFDGLSIPSPSAYCTFQ
jgi:hypothetical protein